MQGHFNHESIWCYSIYLKFNWWYLQKILSNGNIICLLFQLILNRVELSFWSTWHALTSICVQSACLFFYKEALERFCELCVQTKLIHALNSTWNEYSHPFWLRENDDLSFYNVWIYLKDVGVDENVSISFLRD
jgi:hypothetical protein